MKNHIAEDLPARKFAPAAAGAAPDDKRNKKDKSAMTPEERVSQAASDIRYKANLKDIPLLQQYNEYMQNSSMSTQERNMVKAKLFGKEGGGMKAEDFNPIFKDAASDNVAKALFKVFVEQPQPEITEEYIEELRRGYVKQEISRVNRDAGKIRYKIRVTDKNTKRSYVRYATREKINQLRANPNIESVEMTEYGEPYEGERKKGSQTARVAAGGGLDPVGKEDGDVDNDGDKDKSDKYLMKRRGAIGNAIATRKEEFIHEAGAKKKSKKKKSDKLDVRNGISNKVTIAPTQGGNERVGLMAHNELEGELIAETGYSKFLNMVNEKMNLATANMGDVVKDFQTSDASQFKGKSKKKRQEMAIAAKLTAERGGKKLGEEMDCGSDDKKKKGEEEDPRSIKTKDNLVINKLRAMGLKMSYEPEGEMVDEATRSAREGVPETHRPGLEVDRRVANQNRETPGGRRALKREADARRQQQTPEAQEAKRQRDDESDKIKRINKRPRTKKERADYEGVRRAGNLGS